MLGPVKLDPESGVPLYRQLADAVSRLIDQGSLVVGDRLPPTRELAGQLGLNRTTISAAYVLALKCGAYPWPCGAWQFCSQRV